MKKLFLGFALGLLVATLPTALAMNGFFSDVTQDMWHYDAIQHLAEKDLIKGYEDGSYQPNQSVSRGELAVIADRMIEQQRDFDQNCDKLAVYKNYSWFETLEKTYESELDDPAFPHIELYSGNGCMINEDEFIFVNGDQHHGCHNLYRYQIGEAKLKMLEACAGPIVDLNTKTKYLEYETLTFPQCTRKWGKYYYEDDLIEVNSEACEAGM